jgi:hypothetical protein
MKSKTCPHCKKSKPVSEFYRRARAYSSWCKTCHIKRAHEQANAGYFKLLRAKKNEGKTPRKLLTSLERVAYETYRNALKRSFQNGMDFDLTVEWVTNKFSEFCRENYHTLGKKDPFKPSLDRQDNSQGYVQTNCKVVWMIENLARNTFAEEQVIEFCKRKLGLM